MSRGARRPSFSPSDKGELLKAMREARRLAIQCSAAELTPTDLRAAADALHQAIDNLVEHLTGNREFFWATPHGGAWVKPPVAED
jgi:hypothetical protein